MTQTQMDTAAAANGPAASSPSWHEGRMTAFDVETTGIDYETDRIVTASVATVGGGEPTAAARWLINPGVEIPLRATEVHAITTEHARAHGADPAAAVAEIVDALVDSCAACWPIVAFNARFDLTMLDREARRHGLAPLTDRIAGRHELHVIDPYVLDKQLYRFRRGKRILSVLCDAYGVRLDDAHDADEDALAAARLAYRIGQRGRVVRRCRNQRDMAELVELENEWAEVRTDLHLLHQAQVLWAADQAASLQAYFRDQGKDDVCEPVWPIAPLRDLLDDGIPDAEADDAIRLGGGRAEDAL